MRSPIQHVIFSFFIFSICYDELIAADSPCEDWEAYKDEKCLKILDKVGLQSFDDAKKACSQQENSATLVIIHSKDEVDFLTNLLFKTHKIVDNVWIGVKYTNNKFKWVDDSDLSFINWFEGSPKNKTDYCVQIQSDEASVGKWADEPCQKKNLVICQKMQNWSISRLQKSLLGTRKELQESLEDVRKELKDARTHINNIEQNPVPIGFIYVQLSGQPEPVSLWSKVEWKDVTSGYTGLFFRAEGGGAAVFGQTQEENSPRLTGVKNNPQSDENSEITLSPGIWSKKLWSSATYSGIAHENYGNSFYISSGEVRPRNQAIRIWKRTN